MKEDIKNEKKENMVGKKSPKALLIPLVIVLLILAVAGFILRPKITNYFVSRSLSKQLGGEVKIDGDKVSYKGEGFEFSSDGVQELPENFPKDFPIYKNANLISKWSSTNEGSEGFSLVLETTDTVEKVSDYYKTELEKSDWKIVSTFSQDDSTVFSFEKGNQSGVLGIADTEDKVSITITIGDN